MKEIEKSKLYKILEKIETGIFDENDIDNLFIKLRPYSRDFKIFHELSHFVAHNDDRDRGIINEVLEYRYLNFRYMATYTLRDQEPLNIFQPFPSWILKIIKYRVNDMDKNEFLNNNKLSIGSFLDKVQKSFTIDKKNRTAIYNKPKPSIEFFKIFYDCLNTLHIKIEFNQHDIIEDIIKVLNKNKVTFDDQTIRNQSNKITACLLLLLHNATYSINSEQFAKTQIEFCTDREDSNTLFKDKKLGRLILTGSFEPAISTLQYIDFISPIIETDLIVEEWCDSSLFYLEKGNDGNNIIKVKFGNELKINKEWKFI